MDIDRRAAKECCDFPGMMNTDRSQPGFDLELEEVLYQVDLLVEAKRREWEDLYKRLRQKIASQRQEISHLMTVKNQAEQENQLLLKQLNAIQATSSDLAARYEQSLKATKARLAQAEGELETERETRADERDSHLALLRGLEVEVMALRKQRKEWMKSAQEEVAAYKSKYNVTKLRYDDCFASLSQLRREMERLEKSFWEKESKEHVQSSELKLDAKDIKARNAMLQKKVEDLEGQLQRYHSEGAQKESMSSSEIEWLKRDVSVLNEAMKTRDATIAQLEQALNRALKDLSATSNEQLFHQKQNESQRVNDLTQQLELLRVQFFEQQDLAVRLQRDLLLQKQHHQAQQLEQQRSFQKQQKLLQQVYKRQHDLHQVQLACLHTEHPLHGRKSSPSRNLNSADDRSPSDSQEAARATRRHSQTGKIGNGDDSEDDDDSTGESSRQDVAGEVAQRRPSTEDVLARAASQAAIDEMNQSFQQRMDALLEDSERLIANLEAERKKANDAIFQHDDARHEREATTSQGLAQTHTRSSNSNMVEAPSSHGKTEVTTRGNDVEQASSVSSSPSSSVYGFGSFDLDSFAAEGELSHLLRRENSRLRRDIEAIHREIGWGWPLKRSLAVSKRPEEGEGFQHPPANHQQKADTHDKLDVSHNPAKGNTLNCDGGPSEAIVRGELAEQLLDDDDDEDDDDDDEEEEPLISEVSAADDGRSYDANLLQREAEDARAPSLSHLLHCSVEKDGSSDAEVVATEQQRHSRHASVLSGTKAGATSSSRESEAEQAQQSLQRGYASLDGDDDVITTTSDGPYHDGGTAASFLAREEERSREFERRLTEEIEDMKRSVSSSSTVSNTEP